MRVLFLTRYDKLGASSRMRSLQYIPWFKSAGIETVVSAMFDDAMLLHKYQHKGYGLFNVLSAYLRRIHVLMKVRQFDLVWIEKEALPWFPAWFEIWMLRHIPYVLDFDDAIFHNYDLHCFTWVRCVYGRRIDRLMAFSRLVIVGNRYLENRAAGAGSRWIEKIPTVVDLVRYVPKHSYPIVPKPLVVWVGSPTSTQYLHGLVEPLAILAKRHPFTLRVVGGDMFAMPGVEVEFLPWSADTEAALIAESDVGIMPLRDSPWERGKCAYKLIQYMACGLPTVSSPIGANLNVVIDGETGFLADTADDWVNKMELLLRDAALRQRLGQAGRKRVEAEYCLQQVAPRLELLLKDAANESHRR